MMRSRSQMGVCLNRVTLHVIAEALYVLLKSMWKEIIDDKLSVCIRDTHTGKLVGKFIPLKV